jgi:phosphatidylinositol-3-phosphatase
LVGAALLSALLACPALAATAAAAPTGAAADTTTHPKVLVIAEENHTYRQIIGSPRAPYLNRLAADYGVATAVQAGYPTNCPSLAAYALMTSGSTHGICDDRGPRHHRLAGDNIFAQVAAAGLTWRNYAEDAPHPCARHNGPGGVFLVRHTPPAYYLSERGRCPTSDIPLGTPTHGALHRDVVAGRLPAYAFVSPNACHDMHGAPSCNRRMIENGDAWLAGWVPQILAGPDFRSGRLLIVITWDEGSKTSNHIPTLILSPRTRHITATAAYTHCSILATIEEVLRLPRLGCAATAATLTAAFRL